MHPELRILQQQIQLRAGSIVDGHSGEWPCRKGCGYCCSKLASIPLLTRAEWEQLESGLAGLPADTRAQIEERILALRDGPIICPFLDRDSQSCLVYEHRPIACRTYGFYVERDKGLYCGDILAMVESGATENLVWGNAARVEEVLDRMGERRDLKTWFSTSARHRGGADC